MPFLSAETCGAAHKPTQMLKKVFLTMPTSLARSDNVLLTGSCKEIELRVLSTIGTGSYLFCNLSQKCATKEGVQQLALKVEGMLTSHVCFQSRVTGDSVRGCPPLGRRSPLKQRAIRLLQSPPPTHTHTHWPRTPRAPTAWMVSPVY